jgi:hypothetical protein
LLVYLVGTNLKSNIEKSKCFGQKIIKLMLGLILLRLNFLYFKNVTKKVKKKKGRRMDSYPIIFQAFGILPT